MLRAIIFPNLGLLLLKVDLYNSSKINLGLPWQSSKDFTFQCKG